MIRALAATLALIGSVVSASDIQSDLEDLVAQHRLDAVSLTVLRPDGSILADLAVGKSTQDPSPLLSISKTLAGACTMHASRSGLVSLDDTVAAHLDWDGTAGDATVAELLTHTSGYHPDRTQRDVLGLALTRPARVAALLEKRSKTERGEKGYAYSNENYLVLEAVLSSALGVPALTWCLNNVPALVAMKSLRPSPAYHALGLAGGLAANTRDLARFMFELEQGDDWPGAEVRESIIYGPGILRVAGGPAERLSHQGALCVIPRRGNSAIATRDALGWSVAFTYNHCPNRDVEASLQKLLLAAIAAD